MKTTADISSVLTMTRCGKETIHALDDLKYQLEQTDTE